MTPEAVRGEIRQLAYARTALEAERVTHAAAHERCLVASPFRPSDTAEARAMVERDDRLLRDNAERADALSATLPSEATVQAAQRVVDQLAARDREVSAALETADADYCAALEAAYAAAQRRVAARSEVIATRARRIDVAIAAGLPSAALDRPTLTPAREAVAMHQGLACSQAAVGEIDDAITRAVAAAGI